MIPMPGLFPDLSKLGDELRKAHRELVDSMDNLAREVRRLRDEVEKLNRRLDNLEKNK